MPTHHLVLIRGEVSPRIRRLAKMRAAELDLSISQYIAALIISDTKHLGSLENDDENGNVA